MELRFKYDDRLKPTHNVATVSSVACPHLPERLLARAMNVSWLLSAFFRA